MKHSIIFASALMVAGPAFAGPFVNIEANAGLAGSNYVGTVTEAHAGYESTSGNFSYYGQLGPALVTPESGDSNVQLSGKIGAGVDVTDKLNVYGEYWALTGGEVENLTSNFKLGVKYNF
jgi:outer membrane autotransporter protein